MKKLLTLVFTAITFWGFAQNPLLVKIEKYAKGVSGNVGVCATILETGQTVEYNGDKKFPMQSVYKLPIAMAVLNGIYSGKLSLEQTVRINRSDFISAKGHSPVRDKFPNGTDISILELLKYSITESDGSASDALLNILNGSKTVNTYIRELRINDMVIATTEKIQVENDTIQYRNWATPKAFTTLLSFLYNSETMPEKSRTLLLQYMVASIPGAKRLKGLLPPGTIVAHKTGTARTINNLTRATNDAGIINLPNGRHLAITVFISDSYSDDSNRELTIANIAKAAFDWANN